MGRNKKQLTQEQIDFRNCILRKKIMSVVNSEKQPVPVLTDDDKIKKCFYFINNCVFWMNEYIGGKKDKKCLLETSRAMQENARNLEMLLVSEMSKLSSQGGG